MNNQFERNNRNPCLHIGFHEAGHYVVAKALGFKTNGIVIKNINDLSICLNTHVETESASIYQDIRTNDDICAYLEKRIQVLSIDKMRSLSTWH